MDYPLAIWQPVNYFILHLSKHLAQTIFLNIKRALFKKQSKAIPEYDFKNEN
jgi:hypothetical protein